MRNAVREYVSTINAKVSVKQNVIAMSICSLWVNIFISWMGGSFSCALFGPAPKVLRVSVQPRPIATVITALVVRVWPSVQVLFLPYSQ